MPQPLFFDPAEFDLSKPLYDKAAIRGFNQQRFEMEMLDGVLFHDLERKMIGGFLRLAKESWWARGHFPDRPLLPGVLSLEAGGQLCSIYFARVAPGARMGLAKIEEARMYRPMEPPRVLFIAGKLVHQKLRFAQFDVQGFIDGEVTFESRFTGVAL